MGSRPQRSLGDREYSTKINAMPENILPAFNGQLDLRVAYTYGRVQVMSWELLE